MKTMPTLDELLLSPKVQKSINYHSYNIDPSDRQDLIQDFYVAIVNAYDNIRNPESAEAVCHTIIRQQKLMYFRNKRRNQLISLGGDFENEDGDSIEGLDLSLYVKDDISYEFADFQESYRQIRGVFFEGEREILDAIILDKKFNLDVHGEATVIAEQLGFTKAYVSRSIKKLREALSK